MPLDPAHPAERSRIVLEDSGAGCILIRSARLRLTSQGYAGERGVTWPHDEHVRFGSLS